MKSVNKFCELLKSNAEKSGTVEKDGLDGLGTIYRLHHSSERYIIDFADDFTAEGWMQLDTDQDAPYYGIWVNPITRQQLGYAEGDWRLEERDTKESYNTMIDELLAFHQPVKNATVYDLDAKTRTEIFQPRDGFKAV